MFILLGSDSPITIYEFGDKIFSLPKNSLLVEEGCISITLL